MSKTAQTSDATKKPIFKKWWFWVIVVVVLIAIGASANGGGQANETTKTTEGGTTQEKLTLDDGWVIDTASGMGMFVYVDGYVSNNTDKDISNYIQITFTGYDADGASVGSCLDNVNQIDANGKWKFHAICTGDGVKTVKFKEITGF